MAQIERDGHGSDWRRDLEAIPLCEGGCDERALEEARRALGLTREDARAAHYILAHCPERRDVRALALEALGARRREGLRGMEAMGEPLSLRVKKD